MDDRRAAVTTVRLHCWPMLPEVCMCERETASYIISQSNKNTNKPFLKTGLAGNIYFKDNQKKPTKKGEKTDDQEVRPGNETRK